MDKPAISITNLKHRYQGDWHLHVPGLTLNFGHIYGLIGRNGAGKSSLMKFIAGAEQPLTGHISCASTRVGHIHPQTAYPGYLRVGQLASLFRSRSSQTQSTWDDARFTEIVNVFNVDSQQQYRNLSTGERAGLHLAIMLSQHPQIWLLDEPTLGIDVVAINHCLEILSQMFMDDQPCVLFSTHQMYELERLTDQVLILTEGRLTWHGETESLHDIEPTFRHAIEAMLQPAKEASV